jgi:hypothetical protein
MMGLFLFSLFLLFYEFVPLAHMGTAAMAEFRAQ